MPAQVADFGGPAVSDAARQLVREWSDPAAAAHPDWFADEPPALLDAALRSQASRRLLSRRLRERVPLLPRWSAASCATSPWTLGERGALHAAAEHAGWVLLQPQVLRMVSRRAIECVVRQVGRRRYEAAFDATAALWRGDAPADLPDLAAAAAGSADGLTALLRHVGWCAINQVFDLDLAVLRSRMHLVAGPQCAAARAATPWDIDAAQFMDLLRGLDDKALQ